MLAPRCSSQLLQEGLLSTEAMLCCSFIPEARDVGAEAVLRVMHQLPATRSQA